MADTGSGAHGAAIGTLLPPDPTVAAQPGWRRGLGHNVLLLVATAVALGLMAVIVWTSAEGPN